MKTELLLYTRKDCCLCEEMKSTLSRVAGRVPFALEEIDVDTSPALQEKYGNERPRVVHQWSQGIQVSVDGQGIGENFKARSSFRLNDRMDSFV